ncbi:MAG: rhodanese-like domain-containing protein [Nocardioides sp.]
MAEQQEQAARGTIDIESFAAEHAQGAAVVDVRERGEWLGGHLSGSKLIPMSQLGARVQDFPTDQPVYLVCTSGSRSGQAAEFLRSRGVDAINVAGGIAAWEQRGWALERGA